MALIDDIKTDPILFYATCALALVGFASVGSKLTSFFRTLIQAYLLRGIPVPLPNPTIASCTFSG